MIWAQSNKSWHVCIAWWYFKTLIFAGLFLKGTSNSIVAHQYRILGWNLFCSQSTAQIEAAVHSMCFVSMTISWGALCKGPLIREKSLFSLQLFRATCKGKFTCFIKSKPTYWFVCNLDHLHFLLRKKKKLRCCLKSYVFPQFINLNKLSSLCGEIDCRTVGFLGLIIAWYPDNLNSISLVFSYGLWWWQSTIFCD